MVTGLPVSTGGRRAGSITGNGVGVLANAALTQVFDNTLNYNTKFGENRFTAWVV
jgi:hypothetical protein